MNWEIAAGDTLRQRRRAAGLSQRALAVRAGVKQTQVARIETHRTQPTLPVLGRLLDALDTEFQSVDIKSPDAREIKELIAGNKLSPTLLGECFRAAAGIVDELRRSTPHGFRRSVASAPESTGVPGFDALIASLVEDSCEKVSVDPPDWVDDEWRFVEQWFTSGVPSLRNEALSDSPPAFRRHGVFSLLNEFSRA
jgi:transcriptional regulator with XRE-family HTH domain